MNEEWTHMNKRIQQQMNKKSYKDGIATLLQLRNELMNEIMSWKNELEDKDYYAIPFINAKGYHSKTIAYSLWHIFRIEDIVVHSLIKKDRQIFFEGDYQSRMNAPVISTGNELVKEQIAEFSKCLSTEVLYEYIAAVKASTDEWLQTVDYAELKRKFVTDDKERIVELNVVSKDENAFWLIDYWCSKDVKGLLLMPLSRHWIMHTEAAMRIKNKLKKK